MQGFGAIPVFVAVVENGGFSAAARMLGVSTSAVSKRINQLEQHLGVRLLHRTTRKLSLTEAGERYFEHAAQALTAAGQAEDAVTEMQGEPQGKLKISSPMSFGRLHVAPLMPKLMQRYPKLRIDLVMDDRKVDLLAEGFGAIPVFVAVVKNGSFSAAARALGVSKSAVSKRINQLEKHLGARLMQRTTRKLSLTEAGERYFEHAAQALTAAGQAEDAVTELQGEPQGKLRISSPMSFGRLHVAPLIPKLLKRYTS